MLYLIGKKDNPQLSLMASAARKNGVDYTRIDTDDPQFTVSISPEELLINGLRPESKSVFFLSGVYYQFPFLPEEKAFTDWTYFQDFHLSQQQLKSQLYSLLYILSCKKDEYTLVNDFIPSINLTSRYEVLLRLKDGGFRVPKVCLSNSLLEAQGMHKSLGGVLWSYPDSNSPIREITYDKLDDLFNGGHSSIPYLLYEPVRGNVLRLSFFEDRPILVNIISPPERKAFSEELEKFTYCIPEGELEETGRKLYREFGAGFYEVFGILDDEGTFWFYDISFDPNISYMDQDAQNYTASRLLELMLKKGGIEKKIPCNDVLQGKRNTVFLKRMLVHLFEIQQNQELK